jgi:hypothetical protein
MTREDDWILAHWDTVSPIELFDVLGKYSVEDLRKRFLRELELERLGAEGKVGNGK